VVFHLFGHYVAVELPGTKVKQVRSDYDASGLFVAPDAVPTAASPRSHESMMR
jgi:hypothetical protein